MPNLIYGDQFEKLCDYVCHGIALETVQNSPNIVPGCKLMFCEGHNFQHAIEHIKRRQHETFVLVSHNSDANILDHTARNCDYHYIESEIPGNIKKIYAQNLNVLSDRIRPLPIGLENYRWHRGKKWEEIELMISQDEPRDRWVYVNHAIATNLPERVDPYRFFADKPWATCKERVGYLEYLTDLKKHKFRICPQGNGLSTHSTWESLYMHNIPITKRIVATEMFSKIMPIVLVDNWTEITVEFLEKKEIEITNTEYKNNYLDMNFWVDVIKSKIKIV